MYSVQITMKIFIHFVKKKRKKRWEKTILKKRVCTGWKCSWKYLLNCEGHCFDFRKTIHWRQKMSLKKKEMSLHFVTYTQYHFNVQNVSKLMCLHQNNIFFIDFSAVSVHLSQIVTCTRAILCILLN